MSTGSYVARIAFVLMVPLWFATNLNAQRIDRQAGVSLTVEPARITLNAGESQKFSAHLEGAPAGAVIIWAVPDGERDVSSVTQDGVFIARIVGVYHVLALATIESRVLKTSVVKVTVLGKSEF